MTLIKTHLKELGYPEKITSAQITVDLVTFIDGSQWAGDVMLYPDPNDPRRKFNPQIPEHSQIPNASQPDQAASLVKSSVFSFRASTESL